MGKNKQPIAVAITGASGSIYALRLLGILLKSDETVYLMISQAGLVVLGMEEGLSLGSKPGIIKKRLVEKFECRQEQLQVFGEQDWLAPPASGSAKLRGMVIIPCTTGTLGAIASGVSNCLINRAADVCMKEKNPLIMVVRETPFSTLHLENMLKLAHAGVTIMPANPAFYHNPTDIMGVVDYMVARVLDHLGVEQNLLAEWGKEK
ncbi:MAG: UbiX family flavin prenyltransferase [Gammaproteobacteria bacterium]|nr:UbiX family flavin prenyltransferase [Gammaproteobacteria bacterium]